MDNRCATSDCCALDRPYVRSGTARRDPDAGGLEGGERAWRPAPLPCTCTTSTGAVIPGMHNIWCPTLCAGAGVRCGVILNSPPKHHSSSVRGEATYSVQNGPGNMSSLDATQSRSGNSNLQRSNKSQCHTTASSQHWRAPGTVGATGRVVFSFSFDRFHYASINGAWNLSDM